MSESHPLQQFLFPSLILKEPILLLRRRDPFFGGQEFRLLTTQDTGIPLRSITLQHLSGPLKLLVRHLRCLGSRLRSGLDRIVNSMKRTIEKPSEHGIWRISFEDLQFEDFINDWIEVVVLVPDVRLRNSHHFNSLLSICTTTVLHIFDKRILVEYGRLMPRVENKCREHRQNGRVIVRPKLRS